MAKRKELALDSTAVKYLKEFIRESYHKPTHWLLPQKETSTLAYVIQENLAKPEIQLTRARSPNGADVSTSLKVAEVFTWGIFCGTFLT